MYPSPTKQHSMPDSNILAFLFSTVAALVATLTGLIGAFSTFRLQTIYNELALLIEMMRNRRTAAGTLDEWIERADYSLLERIYDLNQDAITALREALDKSGLTAQHVAYEYDYANIVRNHNRYAKVRRANQRNVRWALAYVFVSLLMLVCTNLLLQLPAYVIITCLGIYLTLAAFTFTLFIKQLRLMVA